MAEIRPIEEHELLSRASWDSATSFSDPVHEDLPPHPRRRQRGPHSVYSWIASLPRLPYPIFKGCRNSRPSRQQYRRYCCWTVIALPCIIVLLPLFTAIFRPSYSNPPEHYKVLERKCKNSRDPGRGNVNHEKVLITSSLYDQSGLLLGGKWGTAVTQLVQLLGPKNVHLSVYENDADDLAKGALDKLRAQLNCNVSLVSEHLPLEDLPRITIPSGERRLKRMAFLAEVRNRALSPLHNSSTHFDKILIINDVIFNPIEAVQLLFSTNIDAHGRAQYGAACAFDFINPFKFYDRFATRDFDGYETGIPFFPWFTAAGAATSRQDVLAQKDAVRVRSCWGGMTAFEARWFQSQPAEPLPADATTSAGSAARTPLRFRYEEDVFWDASECCLIHADLAFLRQGRNSTAAAAGIYANPYVRVAYDSRTLGWLPYARRVERAFPFVHNLLNRVAGLPARNPRMRERPGDVVVDKVWRFDGDGEVAEGGRAAGALKGSFHDVKRIADPGGFCGSRVLMVLREDPKEGEKNWMKVPIPLPPG